MMIRFGLVGILVLLGACAEGETSNNADMGTTNNVSSPTNNVTTPTNGQTTPDDDTGPSCGVCCPMERSCTDQTTVGVCRADGQSFETTACDEGQVCENAECVDPPVCQPGDRSCYDSVTLLTCRQTGDGFTTSPCDEGLSCVDGECLSGSPNGTACNSDDECASGECRCGSSTDDTCPNSPSQGYCAARSCDSESCGVDGACFAAEAAPLDPSVDFDHCLSKCTPGSCAPGLTCIGVPSRGETGLEWNDACYFEGFVAIGGECTQDSQCIGGVCLTDYFSPDEPGYCTRRCDEDSSCPDNAACVNLRAGTFYCSLKCGSGSVTGNQTCPFDTASRFDVTCANFNRPDGTAVRTCASQRD